MELIFFTTSHNMLSFTSKQTKNPTSKFLNSACTASRFYQFLIHSPQPSGLGGNSWPKLIKGKAPQHVTSCSAIKTVFCDGGCFSKVAAAQTLAGQWSAGGIIEGLCISWDWFSSPLLIKIPLSWPMSFSCFWSPNSFPHPTDGEEWAKWVGA